MWGLGVNKKRNGDPLLCLHFNQENFIQREINHIFSQDITMMASQTPLCLNQPNSKEAISNVMKCTFSLVGKAKSFFLFWQYWSLNSRTTP
jgi:hypothetical protein